MKYDYPTAFQLWGDEEEEAMARVKASGRFTMGPETEAFEAELAEFNQRKHAIAVNSGSSANLIAVAALAQLDGLLTGNWSALVPALAWATTYAPLVQYRARALVLRDCDQSWSAPIEETQCDIRVVCSILGIPAKLTDLENDGVVTLNDDCEALGATIGGRPTAAYGDVATQSFFWSHQLSGIEGGAVLTDDDDLARLCRMLRDHGMTRSVEKATRFEDEYKFEVFGYNVRPVEMHMAICRAQLPKMGMHRVARRKNWALFNHLTEGCLLVQPTLTEGANPFGIHFELISKEARDIVARALRAAGIDCRLPTGGSIRKHPYGRFPSLQNQITPNADRIHDCGMFIGNAPFDISALVERAADVLKEYLKP